MIFQKHRREVKNYQSFLDEIKDKSEVLLEVYSPEDEDAKKMGMAN